MPATFAALAEHSVDAPLGNLFGVTTGADRGHDNEACLLELRNHVGSRRLGEGCNLDLCGDQMIDPLFDIDGVGSKIHAEGFVRALVHLVDRFDHLVEGHGGGGEDAESASVGGPADE